MSEQSEEFDGRDLVGANTENTEFYVGVDPMYQNYANEGEKPYPFHEEEIEARARAGGIPEGEQSGFQAMLIEEPGVGEEDQSDDTGDPEVTSPPAAPVIPPQPKSTK